MGGGSQKGPELWVCSLGGLSGEESRREQGDLVRGSTTCAKALGQTALRLAGGRGRREDERGTGAGGEGPGTRKARLPRQGKVWRAGWRGQSRDAPLCSQAPSGGFGKNRPWAALGRWERGIKGWRWGCLGGVREG